MTSLLLHASLRTTPLGSTKSHCPVRCSPVLSTLEQNTLFVVVVASRLNSTQASTLKGCSSANLMAPKTFTRAVASSRRTARPPLEIPSAPRVKPVGEKFAVTVEPTTSFFADTPRSSSRRKYAIGESARTASR
jgi:hypothetical protein